MKRLIYFALTLIAAMNIFGCSTPVTEDELAAIHEAQLKDTGLVPQDNMVHYI